MKSADKKKSEDFYKIFKPQLTPQKMLEMGVFGGAYFSGKIKEYPNSDLFLFDYKPSEKELPGGNAKKFNWSFLSELNIKKPWFLSGGINISNINKIKEYANPDGIDLSSGVEEAPGIKNTKMINRLFNKYYEK